MVPVHYFSSYMEGDGPSSTLMANGPVLTPKGLTVPSLWGTNGIWVASLDLILFLEFLKLFVNMRLRISFAGVQIS
jgi:hypothetical protein